MEVLAQPSSGSGRTCDAQRLILEHPGLPAIFVIARFWQPDPASQSLTSMGLLSGVFLAGTQL